MKHAMSIEPLRPPMRPKTSPFISFAMIAEKAAVQRLSDVTPVLYSSSHWCLRLTAAASSSLIPVHMGTMTVSSLNSSSYIPSYVCLVVFCTVYLVPKVGVPAAHQRTILHSIVYDQMRSWPVPGGGRDSVGPHLKHSSCSFQYEKPRISAQAQFRISRCSSPKLSNAFSACREVPRNGSWAENRLPS
jgi:hypothetical protein